MDNLLPKYYQKDNERLQEKTREKYQHLFEVKKEKKTQYGGKRYGHVLSRT